MTIVPQSLKNIDPSTYEAFLNHERPIGLMLGDAGYGKSTLSALLAKTHIENGGCVTIFCDDHPVQNIKYQTPWSTIMMELMQITSKFKIVYDGDFESVSTHVLDHSNQIIIVDLCGRKSAVSKNSKHLSDLVRGGHKIILVGQSERVFSWVPSELIGVKWKIEEPLNASFSSAMEQ